MPEILSEGEYKRVVERNTQFYVIIYTYICELTRIEWVLPAFQTTYPQKNIV